MLEANVETNRMVSKKWTYYKERSFASNYLIYLKICFSLRASYKELIWCINDPNAHIPTFCKRWSFIWRYFFSVSILKNFIQDFPWCIIKSIGSLPDFLFEGDTSYVLDVMFLKIIDRFLMVFFTLMSLFFNIRIVSWSDPVHISDSLLVYLPLLLDFA